MNWIYRYFTEDSYTQWLVWICGLIQTIIYADFFYYYFKRFARYIPALIIVANTTEERSSCPISYLNKTKVSRGMYTDGYIFHLIGWNIVKKVIPVLLDLSSIPLLLALKELITG